MIVHHNFFRPHGGIGKITPAEAAGIVISGTDKQITLISKCGNCSNVIAAAAAAAAAATVATHAV